MRSVTDRLYEKQRVRRAARRKMSNRVAVFAVPEVHDLRLDRNAVDRYRLVANVEPATIDDVPLFDVTCSKLRHVVAEDHDLGRLQRVHLHLIPREHELRVERLNRCSAEQRQRRNQPKKRRSHADFGAANTASRIACSAAGAPAAFFPPPCACVAAPPPLPSTSGAASLTRFPAWTPLFTKSSLAETSKLTVPSSTPARAMTPLCNRLRSALERCLIASAFASCTTAPTKVRSPARSACSR